MDAHRHVAAVEQIVGHDFSDKDLIEAALTHPSAVEGRPVFASYERLEFLGDSILGAIIARELYERYPGMDEGDLTHLKISLVSGKTLSTVARDLGLAEHIIFGESELGTGVRGMNSALENVFEALVGALYLDGGITSASTFVLSNLEPLIDSPLLAQHRENPKSRLQELTQRQWRSAPEYRIEREEGPAHSPTFTSVVLVHGRRVGRGKGATKKESEAAAAADALERMENGSLLMD